MKYFSLFARKRFRMWKTIADLFEIGILVEAILSDLPSFRFDRFNNSDTRRRITDSLFNGRRWFDPRSRNSVLKEVVNIAMNIFPRLLNKRLEDM